MSNSFEKPQCDETYIPTDADWKELAEYILTHDVPYEPNEDERYVGGDFCEGDYAEIEDDDWGDIGHNSYFFSNFEEHE